MRIFRSKDAKKKEHDKRRKSKSSKDGGSVAQTQSSGPESVSYDALPEDFSFLWSVDAIETNNDIHPPRVLGLGGKNNDIAKLRFPPNRAKRFRVVNRGDLYRWTEDDCEKLSRVPRPKNTYGVASIFFQARQDNFVACYKNCAGEDIFDQEYGWCYLGFNHRSEGLSEVEICPRAEYEVLAAPAKGSTWMPQVVPAVYDYNTTVKGVTSYSGPFGGLCGNLALLIGMAAFSTSVENAESTVAECFRFGDWVRHDAEIGIGRYPERGVIVSIYLDPNAADSMKNHLRSFEKGKYGPIFYTEPDDQEDPGPSAAPEYALSSTIAPAATGHDVPRGLGTPMAQPYTYTLSSPVATFGEYPSSVAQSVARSETEEGDEVVEE